MANEKISVLDMVNDYASDNGMDPADIFKKPEPKKEQEPVETVSDAETEVASEPVIPAEKPAEEKVEVSDSQKSMMELAKGMSEFTGSSGVVYNKEDVHLKEEPLKNIADEDAINEAQGEFNEEERMHQNIEEAKKRFGISKLQIPEGFEQVNFRIAASDPDHRKAQEALDKLFDNLIKLHPEFILEWSDPSKKPVTTASDDAGEHLDDQAPDNNEAPAAEQSEIVLTREPNKDDEVNVVIDKRNASEINWSEDEVSKIRRARTINLNIVEDQTVNFGTITNISGNAVDDLLSKYERTANDIVAALPASKYRATFTGLTYAEVVDLSASQEMNTYDGERKKWTICYSHIRNQSIGPWEEYIEYEDPATKKMVRDSVGATIPDDVDGDTVHTVTKFEDFMRKTSYADLEFMLWKILCATSMDKELIQITCGSLLPNGKPCHHVYDWIYSPNELLDITKVNSGVLKDMKETGEASGPEQIKKVYESSLLNSSDCATLPKSGIIAVFGHVSANTYLEELYSPIKDSEDNINTDPDALANRLHYQNLLSVKQFRIPNKKDGGYYNISGVNDLLKVLDALDDIDYQVVSKVVSMETEPYKFKFSMRDVVCPKCKNRTIIPINDMTDLLFLLAQSLATTNITLGKL